MENYPTEATERFDDARFHRKYCMSFIKIYKGKVLEVGAGCGVLREIILIKIRNFLSESDKINFDVLYEIFK